MTIKERANQIVRDLCFSEDAHPDSYTMQVIEAALIEVYNTGIEDATSMTTPATAQCIRSLKKETKNG